jgi:hypothetical protein
MYSHDSLVTYHAVKANEQRQYGAQSAFYTDTVYTCLVIELVSK